MNILKEQNPNDKRKTDIDCIGSRVFEPWGLICRKDRLCATSMTTKAFNFSWSKKENIWTFDAKGEVLFC